MKHIATIAAALFLVVLLSFPDPALPQGNISLGRVQIHPEISYQGTWDDNIFLDHTDEESDYLHTLSPGLELEYRRDAENFLLADARVDIIRYSDFSENDYEEYTFGGQGLYTAPSGFFAEVRERFVDTEDPYSTLNNFQLGTPRVRRWYNTSGLTLGLDLGGPWTLETSYDNYHLEYDEFRDQWQDRSDHRFEVRSTYRVLPKTSLLLIYRLQDQSYPNQDDVDENNQGIDSNTSQDNQYHQVFTGLTFDPTAKITGELKLGASKKDYDNERNQNNVEFNEDIEWTAETNLVYLMSPKTRFRLELIRNTYESTDVEAASYTSTRFGLGGTQELFRRVSLNADLAYIYEDYETGAGFPSREDDVYVVSLGLNYQLRAWLGLGLGYVYENRSTSNDQFQEEEYTHNQVMWTITARF
ncbi:MAG: outer membrane beta-barrel protein [Desulfohalobiaceae bacterium]|nr:outer membrane beta-barrel protein [Desulfohalobiaceae bacterium]